VSTLEKAIVRAARRGELTDNLMKLTAAIAAMPRWRFIRRFHLERQLMLWSLCHECFEQGYSHGQRTLESLRRSHR